MIETEEKQKRPELLKVLCILTFIGSGFSLISNLSMGMLIDVIREMYQQGSFDMWLNKESTIAFELMINADSLFFFIQAIVYCISVFGAFMMWNFKKLGFHLYTIAQILLVITTQIFIPGLPFPFFEVMISLVFISFYARFLKIMT